MQIAPHFFNKLSIFTNYFSDLPNRVWKSVDYYYATQVQLISYAFISHASFSVHIGYLDLLHTVIIPGRLALILLLQFL